MKTKAGNLALDVEFSGRRLTRRYDIVQPLPLWIWAVVGAAAVGGMSTANPILTPCALCMLPFLAILLWFKGEPPILLFACIMQWLQASAYIFYTDYFHLSIADALGGPEFETATWLSLAGVAVLAVGMRIALIRRKHSQHYALRNEALRVRTGSAFILYLVTFGIATMARLVAFIVPGLTQPIVALESLKWVGLFVLAYSVIEQRRSYVLLWAAVGMEILVGVLGFFATFKSVLFLLLVVALTSPFALKGRRLAGVAILGITLFVAGIVWTSIKVDYRSFLNQGTNQQVVVVSAEDSLHELGDLVSNFKWGNVGSGLDALVVRIGYVNYFALVLTNVPSSIPYEHGALWREAIKRTFTPRLFFPEKSAVNDSDRTSLYTGIQTAGVDESTSIGLGYMAESYVDFGPVLMFLPILLLGGFYGLIYRIFVLQTREKLLGAAIGSAILIFGAYTIETSNIKIVGGNVVVLLAMSVLYILLGRSVSAWLIDSSSTRT